LFEFYYLLPSLDAQGYISYPRTETSQYPASFDLRGALQEQTRAPWGDKVCTIFSPHYGMCFGNFVGFNEL
jgi:DNA topoisomerase-3